METNHFEVVVCGSEPAGLIAAALLARRGMRVLVCDLERTPASFVAGGHLLPRDPGLLPQTDAEPAARVLRELNCVPVVRRRAPVTHPGLQLVWPRGRLNLDATTPRPDQLERLFPGEGHLVAQALERLRATGKRLDPLLASDLTLPPDGFWERREVARVEGQLPSPATDLLAPLPAAHPLRATLGALATLGTSLAPLDAGNVAQARAVEVGHRGLFRLDGASIAWRELFVDKLTTALGEVRERLTPVELMFRRGRPFALRMRPRDEMIGLDHLVWAAPLPELTALCGDQAPRRLRDVAAAIRPACYRYTLVALVRRQALPADLGSRVIAVGHPEQPAIEDNALLLTVGLEGPRQPGLVPLWVDCLVPAAAAAAEGYLSVVRSRVRERLMALAPDLERHLVLLASPHDGLPPELPGAAEPEPVRTTPMRPAFTCDLPRVLGVGAAPLATGLKNVLLVGAGTLPGLGVEGDFAAGWGVAKLLGGGRPRRDFRHRQILTEEM